MTWRRRETATVVNFEVRWESKRSGGRVAVLDLDARRAEFDDLPVRVGPNPQAGTV